MSTIAEKLQSLIDDKTAITSAISNKGVTVPDGSGFNDFADLIDGIVGGYQAKYEAIAFSGMRDTLSFTLPFKPLGVAIKCNETPQLVYDGLSVVTANTLGLMSGFLFEDSFDPQFAQNLPSMVWVQKTSQSTMPELVVRNVGGLITSTDNGDGTWSVSIARANAGSYSFRFVSGQSGFNIMFIGTGHG